MRRCFAMAMLSAIVAVAAAAGPRPVGVSPGSASGARIADPCPTFSWSAMPGANSYSIAVYSLGAEAAKAPVSRGEIPAVALSWTPALEGCLARGGSYAWTVGARFEDSGIVWSEPLLFQVVEGPSDEELQRALEVVSRYLAAQQQSRPSAPAAERGAAPDVPGAESKAPEAAAAAEPDVPATNVHGTGPEFSVTDVGVVSGHSFVGDGSGLTNVSAAFATNADLFDGLNSPSFLRSDVTDIFTGGELTFQSGSVLDINGTLQLPGGGISGAGSGSGLDADRLDGLHGASFLTENESAAAFAAHEAADHVKYVFVSAAIDNGNLSGRSGADSQCQSEADAAGLPGEYAAWLSGILTSDEARDVLRQFPGDFVLPDGTKVADGWSDLTDGTLDHQINMRANGTVVVTGSPLFEIDEVWTGTATNGAKASNQNSCGTLGQGWIDADQFNDGRIGDVDRKDTGWTNLTEQVCNKNARFYCFQQ